MKQTRVRLRYIILILLFGCAFFSTCMLYIYQTNQNFKEELYSYLKDVSIRNSEIMKLKIDNNIYQLSKSSRDLFDKEMNTKQQIVKELNELDLDIDYNRIGFISKDGSGCSGTGKELDFSATAYFKKAMQGESTVSNAEFDPKVINNETVYITPVYERGVIKGALYITQKKQSLVNTLSLGNKDEKIYTAIIDEQGNFVTTEEQLQLLQMDFKDTSRFTSLSVEGLYGFKDSQDRSLLFHFQPLEYNNWYTVSMVSNDIIADKTRDANILILSFLIIMALIIIGILYQVIRNHSLSKKEIKRITSYDDVTESDNYTAFLNITKKWLKEEKRNGWCAIHFDIKDFNIINSLLGYIEGDHLLKNVFDVIHQDCKDGEYCARIEADCFVVLWHLGDVETIKARLKKIDEQICHSFVARSYHEELLLYYGVYLIKETDVSFVKCVDKAKYCKKYCKANNKIVIYEDSMYENRMKERNMENRMYLALGNHEFKVFLQPKVDTCRNNKIVSAEALIRWKDPTLGEIYPSEFIPLFERNGFLENLDFYTFDIVCMSLAKWNREIDPNLTVSFNISRSYIFKNDFVRHLSDITDIYGVNRENIEIEIVESMIFEKPEKLLAVVQDLKAQGFRIAMDDFGSGYSSLSMLKQIPFDIIKIDQGFFRTEKHNEEKGKAIVDIIIQLAKKLNVEVITEGIETKEQLDFVKKAGCHVIQGYYFYKPMQLEDFDQLIELKDGFNKIAYSKEVRNHHQEIH